jgi:outer membrane usher protein
VNLSSPITWNAWFKISLILTGLCCSLGETARPDSKKSKISEEALGFGEGGAESPASIPMNQPSAEPEKQAPSTMNSSFGVETEAARTGLGESTSLPEADSSPSSSQLLKMSREELFQKIFQKPLPPRLRDLVVHLAVDNTNLEQIRIHWDEKFEDFRFRSSRLKSFLDTTLLSPGPAYQPDADYSGKALKEARFGVHLDETDFSLVLTIPPELKKRRVRNIEAPAIDAAYGVRVEPAKFSAYLNSRWENAWVYRERFFSTDSARIFWQRFNGAQEPERQPWNGELEGAVRIWDWVLMGNGNVSETSPEQGSSLNVERRETKLIHDFVQWNSRLTLLDVTPRHAGGNYSLPGLLGMDLNLGNAIYSRRGSEKAKVDVFLLRPAGVTVFVNGEPVRTMQMGSGAQTIEGIGGRPGRNTGEVQVSYDDGQVERVPFEFTQSSPDVLPEGRQEGSFSAGVRRIGPDAYGTTPGDVVVAGSYMRGLSPFMNHKSAIAVSRGLQVANLDILLIDDSVTTWNVTSTFSLDSSYRWGQRHDLQYSLKIPLGAVLGRISYIHSRFRNSFFTLASRQKAAFEAGFNVSRALWKGAVSTDFRAQFNRMLDSSTTPIDYNWNLTYSLQAFRGLNFRASAGFNVSSGEYVPAVSFTANYFFNSGRHSIFAMNQTANQKRYVAPKLEQSRKRDSLLVGGTLVFIDRDSSNFVPGSFEYAWRNQSTAGWSWSEGVGMVGGRSVALTGSLAPDQYGVQFSGQNTSNFADMGATYNLSDQSRQDIMSRSHYAVARMSTSLMFADGVFAIGRPVREGFVLVKGKQDLASTTFRVNPSDQNASEFSRGGPWNAASYGMLSAYQTDNIQVVSDHTPGVVNLDGNLFTMSNTYQQGFVLRLGRPTQVFVRLRLVDQASQPLKHTTFQVFAMADTSIALYRSFTNDDGAIQIGGLEAGKRYFIRFGEDAFVKDLQITIPKNASRVYDMGEVKVENQNLSQLSKVSLLTRPDLPGGSSASQDRTDKLAPLPASPLSESPEVKTVN